LRRRSKEAYRLNKLSLHEAVEAKGLDLDIALVYSTKEELSYKTIENAVRRILAEVQERC
jgi:ribonuclease P protein component